MSTTPLRVAVAGLGPKGLFALERLVHHAALRHAPVEVVAFEPHPVPGAGPVYDPAQPAYLRMNLAADRLDLWHGENAAVPAARRLSYTAWRRGHGPPTVTAEEERYPPRGLVGSYLADGLLRLRDALPPEVTLRIVPRTVSRMGRDGAAWSVVDADGGVTTHDEVLLTVGHGTTIAAAPPSPWHHAAPLVPAVLPTGPALTEGIAAGATVAVRGFALTFLDAALALTEGRGGAFAPTAEHGPVTYEPSGEEPGVLLPYSRTGRPMLAKPDPALARSIPGLPGILERGAAMLDAMPTPLRLRDHLLPVIHTTAAAVLRAAGGPATTPAPAGPADEIRRSLEVGAGRRAPGTPWALGQTWQGLYPSLVARLGGDGLATADWPAFLAVASEMERLAFGPPPLNAWRLLALVEARRVDLGWVAGGRPETAGGVTALALDGRRRPVDAVVNAVLAPPGVPTSRPALVSGLLEDGAVRIAAHRRGLEVDCDGTCIARDGGRSEGLAVVGRLAEDSVVGNDTLNRRLHPQTDCWARRVAGAAAAADLVHVS
ncbi:MAG: FAD/NAD(P)-binding protein [Thermoleophilia bacterium]